MRVLVTGGSGFIGQYCLNKLNARNFEVHALSSKPQIISSTIRWHKLNLLDNNDVKEVIRSIKPTHLLHLAWCTQHNKYWSSLENLNWVKTSLTLFEEFVNRGGKRIVAAGTCAEYDWGGTGICYENKTPLNPSTMYGTCKNALQKILHSLSKETGISSAWGRVFSLYGPHEKSERFVASIIKNILNEEFSNCNNADYVRDYLHVEDVASAFVHLLESDLVGPVNIGSGEGVSLGKIVETIAMEIGKKNLINLKLSNNNSQPKFLIANIDILKSSSWKKKHNLESGLANTINWWRTQI